MLSHRVPARATGASRRGGAWAGQAQCMPGGGELAVCPPTPICHWWRAAARGNSPALPAAPGKIPQIESWGRGGGVVFEQLWARGDVDRALIGSCSFA